MQKWLGLGWVTVAGILAACEGDVSVEGGDAGEADLDGGESQEGDGSRADGQSPDGEEDGGGAPSDSDGGGETDVDAGGAPYDGGGDGYTDGGGSSSEAWWPPGTHYYVSTEGNDDNDGSRESPWRTIQHAAEQVEPGVTVRVLPGRYDGNIDTEISGTEAAPIWFISEEKFGAKLDAGDYVWDNYGDWVRIGGFEVTGSGAGGIASDGNDVILFGNYVHDIPVTGCGPNGGAGLYSSNYDGADSHIIGNIVHDIGDRSNPCSRVHGIYHANLRGSVKNNIAYSNQGYGIHLWHAATDVTISNNLAFDNGRSGLVVGAGDNPPEVFVSNCVVTNNIFMNNLDSGAVDSGRVGPNNVYLNNLVFENAEDGMNIEDGEVMGTIEADPLLVNFQIDGSGDYHLTANSPAIDAAVDDGAPAVDFDGAPRPVGSARDVGPFEYGSSGARWPYNPQ